jgi:hypothetical protein
MLSTQAQQDKGAHDIPASPQKLVLPADHSKSDTRGGLGLLRTSWFFSQSIEAQKVSISKKEKYRPVGFSCKV